MQRVSDLHQLNHPQLRAFALQAACLATLEATVRDLEQRTPLRILVEQDASAERSSLAVAGDVVDDARDALNIALSVQVRQWLAEDPEHGTLLRLLVQWPWQTATGTLRDDAPVWVRKLMAYATLPPLRLGSEPQE